MIVKVPVIGMLSVQVQGASHLGHDKIMEIAENKVNDLALKQSEFMGDGFGFRLIGINEFYSDDDNEGKSPQ